MNKKISFTLFIIALMSLPLMAQNGSKKIEIRDITSGVFYARGAGKGFRSMPDGEHYTITSPDCKAILKYSFATGKLTDTLFSVKTAHECTFDKFDDYEISDNGLHILLYTDTEPIYRRSSRFDAFHYDVRRNRVEPLSKQKGKVMIPTFSPDGRMVAFVRDNNIFIKKFDFDTEVQVTDDGKFNSIINGATDWVYEEEFEVTNLMSWSADNNYLSYVRSDETKVPQYNMPIYMGSLYPVDYSYKYPKAGEPNSIVTLFIYNVGDRSTKNVNLGLTPDDYIPRIAFTKEADALAVMTLNRDQNDFKMYYVHPQTLIPKMVFQEKNKAYIDNKHINKIEFIPNGFVYISEKSGYSHIGLYSSKGVEQRQITQGNWDVTEYYGMDGKGNVYYQSAEESPMRRSVYKVDAKGNKTKLSTEEGTNNAIFSSNMAYYFNTYSNINTPSVTAVYATGKTTPLRVLEDNAKLNTFLEQYNFGQKEFITLKNGVGDDLNAWILRPKNFDSAKKYPVLMVQYSGPNSQEVLDKYDFGWEYYLANQGYIVACVDGRGTGARGEAWRKCTYLRLGILESDDQIAAAKSLGALPYVDASRIGIWGWSFGGYTTLMCMSRGNGVFKAGIAVAAPTDWHFYDTIYTERYMRTPKQNPQGYKETSVLGVVNNLKGNLLLIHGSADDNVHLQNYMYVTEAMVQSNIQYETAIYTDKNHGIYGGHTRNHLYTRMADFVLKNL